METAVILVKNLTSQEDANKILTAVEHVWGLTKVEVNLSKREAIVTYDERMASSQDFVQTLVDTGFQITT